MAVVLGGLGLLLVPLAAIPAGAAATVPTVTGPITGGTHGFPQLASSLPLADLGYTEQEFFFEGTAHAYTSATALTSDGAWTATPASSATYRTRMLVRRPSPAKFNGTVVVEWLNVSGGLDSGPFWAQSSEEFIRGGYAYVGVSAQIVGLESFPPDNALFSDLAPKVWDPARYGTLVHPGDSYSYDIFSQAGQALRTPGAVDALGGLHPTRFIAAGESQSAGRLVTYIDAVQPLVHVYDGFLVYSRSASGAPLAQDPLPAVPAPAVVQIRTDLDVPVLVLETETDSLGHFPARQADSARYHEWELAGSAHFDQGGLSRATEDASLLGTSARASTAVPPCGYQINRLPSHYVVSAAVNRIDRWVRDGTPPPTATPITIVAGDTNTITRDADGQALGGIRSPWIDAPLGVLSGQSGSGPVFCRLFGTFTPFDADQLAQHYATRAAWSSAFTAAAAAMSQAGFLLPADLPEVQQRATDDVYAFGDATLAGSTGGVTLNQPVVGIAAAATGGYWEVTADGGIFAFGGAPFLGSTGALHLNQPIVGMAATATGHGYWLVAADGGIFAFGDAPFLGSTGAITLNQPIVGMAPTTTAHGYWLVASDGGVFSFGDAAFAGSTGAISLASPIVGMAADPDGAGYWLAAADGGVFSFQAPFQGSAVGRLTTVNQDDEAIGIAAVPGSGYRIAVRSGRVIGFGPVVNVGDAASNTRSIAGIAGLPDGTGYYLAVLPPF